MKKSLQGVHAFVVDDDKDGTLWAGALTNQGVQAEFIVPLSETEGPISVYPVIPLTKEEFDLWSGIQTNPRIVRINKILSWVNDIYKVVPLLLGMSLLLGIYQAMNSQSIALHVLVVCFGLLVLLSAIFADKIYNTEKKRIGEEKEIVFLRNLIRHKKIDGRLIHLLVGPTKFALVAE